MQQKVISFFWKTLLRLFLVISKSVRKSYWILLFNLELYQKDKVFIPYSFFGKKKVF